ncbi:MAG: hypothetical protein B1H06_03480 [Candidatus Cloacimonas sp. 4484_143]|nr:MAG: hypothetical protein B1H06_03480 [Candidatus Cloacimonas sp. 4484_143]
MKKYCSHYEYLTFKRSGHEFDGKISWNFDRSLILKDRKIINRFDSKVQPENVKIMNTIEEASRN